MKPSETTRQDEDKTLQLRKAPSLARRAKEGTPTAGLASERAAHGSAPVRRAARTRLVVRARRNPHSAEMKSSPITRAPVTASNITRHI